MNNDSRITIHDSREKIHSRSFVNLKSCFVNRPRVSTGFTLIEMMVAVSIFAIVMVVAAGALLTMIDANRKAQALKTVMDNLNLAIENMSRNVRVGTDYRCGSLSATPPDCPNGGSSVYFETANGNRGDSLDDMAYRYNSPLKQLERSTDGGGTWTAITAPEVVIEDLDFYLTGAAGVGSTQPRLLITLRGYAGASERVRTSFTLQTVVSQRLLNE